MDLIITNSPVIPSGQGAGTSSVGTYVSLAANAWILSNPEGWEGAIFLEYDTNRWKLYSSYGVTIALSNVCDVSVQPWQATWPAPMIVSLDKYAPWGGFANWQRLRLLEYV